MSAICGIVHFDKKPVEAGLLRKMAESMAHRGPDGIRYQIAGNVGFAHLALNTTLEAKRELQPLVDPGRGLLMAADARIDNRSELINLLSVSGGLVIDEPTDADLILAAFQSWGENYPIHLLGDFAIAIWDAKIQRLFCVRDYFGVRSLYYHFSNRTFSFASEVKALLVLPWVPRILNQQRVAAHLRIAPWERTSTFFKDINSLLPAHVYQIQDKCFHKAPFWALDPDKEVYYKSDEDYAEAFKEIFTESVHCCLRSSHPVGISLSGGLDSSSIACTARVLALENGTAPLKTFSCVYPNVPESDESEYIQAILDLVGFAPTLIRCDLASPFYKASEVMHQLDAPVLSPNMYIPVVVYNTAQQDGVQVYLDGHDGDEIVSHGRARIAELALSHHWIKMFREGLGAAKNLDHPWWHYFRIYAVPVLVPEFLRKSWRSVRGHIYDNTTPYALTLMNPHFVREFARSEISLGPPRNAREEHFRRLTSKDLQEQIEVVSNLPNLSGIEARHPFYDRRLVEFCLALPSNQKLEGGYTRHILRQSMRKRLPEKIRLRPGKKFPLENTRRLLLTSGKPVLDQIIMNNPGRLSEFVNMERLKELYTDCQAHPEGYNLVDLWMAVSLSLWLDFSKL